MATKAELQTQLTELENKYRGLIARYNALATAHSKLKVQLAADADTKPSPFRERLEALRSAPKGSKLVGGQLVIPGV